MAALQDDLRKLSGKLAVVPTTAGGFSQGFSVKRREAITIQNGSARIHLRVSSSCGMMRNAPYWRPLVFPLAF